jgi:uncharacterized membrane protein
MSAQGAEASIKPSREKNLICILWMLIGLYVALFCAVSFLKFRSFAYDDYDLAYFDQIVWNILHGSLFSSILGIVFLGNHVQLIWFLIAPFYMICPHPLALLFLQSLALGLAAYPLYLLTKNVLGPRWGLLVSGIYLTYPAIGYLNLFELHPTALAPLFLLSMFYFFYKERFGLFMLFLLLAVSCQENISLAAFAMGFYGWCKRRSRRWVIVPFVVIGPYLWLCLKVIIPYFNNNTSQFIFFYSYFGNSLSQMVANVLKHPLQTIHIMFAPLKRVFLIQLFGPLSFVPLLSPLLLLVVSPLFAQHLLSSRTTQVMIQYHYTAEIIPFIFVAFVFGIKNLLRLKWFVHRRSYLGISLLLVSLMFTCCLGPYFELLKMALMSYKMDDSVLMKENFLKEIPPDAPVVATFEFLPRLTHRHELYSFHHQYMGHYTLSNRTYRLPESVRYALLDFNDAFTFLGFYSPERYKNTQELLNRGKWGVVDVKDDIVLLVKDAENKYTLYKILPFEPHPDNPRHAVVAQEIEFLGFDRKKAGPRSLQMTFYWKSLNETKKDLNVFIDFIDENGRVAYRIFRPICYRIYPTNAWSRGQWISEEAYVTIPSRLASGRYSLAMGFYDYWAEQEYFVNPTNPLGRVFLGTIAVR